MKEGGWLLIIFGVIAVALGAMIDVSVDVGYMGASNPYLPGGSAYLPTLPRQVANVHKMHIQALVIQGGFVAIVTGAVVAAAGAIVDAIREGRIQVGTEAKPVETLLSLAAAPVPEAHGEQATGEEDAWGKWVVGVALGIIALIIVIAVASAGGEKSASPGADNSETAITNATDEMNRAMTDMQEAINRAEADVRRPIR